MKDIRVSLSESEHSREALMLFDEAKVELFGKLLREAVAEIPSREMDLFSKQFHIHVPAKRHLGTVTSTLRKLLKHHGVADQVTIERIDLG
jgi:hypothetical protein